jgi:DNA (cytosine-5)-methyltransferase 1
MRVGSLFAGIGGFDLAARWMGWGTAWVSEIDPFACAVLAHHFPDAPNLGDITRIDWSTVERPDLLCGGFPCQDISNAGARAGIDGEHSGLWREYARAIRNLRPRYVVVENVAALLARGIERVLGDLAALGYDAAWHCIPASAVGAPHRRDRIWIIACRAELRGNVADARIVGDWRAAPCANRAGRDAADLRGAAVADARRIGAQVQDRRRHAAVQEPRGDCSPRGIGDRPPDWAIESDVGRVADGVPARVDRLAGLGNAIVPQVAFAIFQAIAAYEHALTTGDAEAECDAA